MRHHPRLRAIFLLGVLCCISPLAAAVSVSIGPEPSACTIMSAKPIPPWTSIAPEPSAFAIAVLLLNLVALLGIIAGQLLRSTHLRDAFRVSFFTLSRAALNSVDDTFKTTVADAAIRSIVLNRVGGISFKKILLISALITLFSGAQNIVMPLPDNYVPDVQIDGQQIQYTSNELEIIRVVGPWFALIGIWAMAFIQTLIGCSLMQVIWRHSAHKSLRARAILLLIGTFALVVVGFLLLLLFVPGLSATWTSEGISINLNISGGGESFVFFYTLQNRFNLLFGILVFAATSGKLLTLPWIFPLKFAYYLFPAVLQVIHLGIATATLMALSSQRGLTLFASAMRRITEMDGENIFRASLTLFAIGTGLCQIFGISWPIGP